MNRLTPIQARETVMSSRAFNQDTAKAKKLAKDGPVIITDRGTPTHVLITFEHFQRLSTRPMSGLEALAPPNQDEHDFDFEIPKLCGGGFRVPDFSDD